MTTNFAFFTWFFYCVVNLIPASARTGCVVTTARSKKLRKMLKFSIAVILIFKTYTSQSVIYKEVNDTHEKTSEKRTCIAREGERDCFRRKRGVMSAYGVIGMHCIHDDFSVIDPIISI